MATVDTLLGPGDERTPRDATRSGVTHVDVLRPGAAQQQIGRAHV